MRTDIRLALIAAMTGLLVFAGGVATSLEAGYGHSFTGAYGRDTGPSDDADFAYFQTRFGY